jgi:hypothetical protein
VSIIEQIKALTRDTETWVKNRMFVKAADLKALAESHERLKVVMKAYMDAFIANDGHPDDTEMTRKMQAAIDEAEKLTEER